MNYNQFKSLVKDIKIDITESQFEKLYDFIELLKEKNKNLNLTSISDDKDIWIKHIFDSLMVLNFLQINPEMKIVDLGTGGGFPGIPLAILFPEAEFLLVDSVEKKIKAVQEFVDELGLKNVKTLIDRAETLGQNIIYREQYDVVLSRAVAVLPALMELTTPLLKVNGYLFAYKGRDYVIEVAESKNASEELGVSHPEVFHYHLPEDMGERAILEIKKNKSTPEKYPRKIGKPTKRPL